MKQKKRLYASLKNKIEENEEKLNMLITKFNKQNNKEQYNEDNKENKSYLGNKNISENIENMFLTEMNSNNESTSISMLSKNNNNSFIRKNYKKKNIIKNQKKYNKKTYSINNPIIKLNYNSNNVPITPNYSIRNNKKIDYSFNYNISKKNIFNRTNKILVKNKNNIDKYNESYIKDKSVLDALNNSIKKEVNLNNMFERFEENQKKKKEKIENMLKKKEDREKKQFTYKPSINKNSKNINKNIKDDFITRQKRYSFIKNKNDEKLKEKILKNEQEKINKNNFLLHKKSQENFGLFSGLNASFISEVSCPSRSMVDINNCICKLFEWDEKRKEKIIKLQKEKSKEINKNKHIPEINKRSKSMVHKNKKENIFVRLSKEDEVVKAKKKIMQDLLSPSFRPNINLVYRKFGKEENIYNNKGIKKISHKIKSFDNKEIKNIRIVVNRNNNIKPKIDIKNDEILKIESEKIENDEIYNKFRKIIINNINKEKINKSFGKR